MIRKNPVRIYSKLCLHCNEPNPPKRNYCSNDCLLKMRKLKKKTQKIYIKKPRKKRSHRIIPKKINPFVVKKIKCLDCNLYATSGFNGKCYCKEHNPKKKNKKKKEW